MLILLQKVLKANAAYSVHIPLPAIECPCHGCSKEYIWWIIMISSIVDRAFQAHTHFIAKEVRQGTSIVSLSHCVILHPLCVFI